MIFARTLALLLGLATLNATANQLADVKLERSPEALKRGAEVVTGVCMGCHSLRYVKYRDLKNMGFSSAALDTLRGAHGLDDQVLRRGQSSASTQAQPL